MINGLFRPNEELLKASCKCRKETLYDYEKALYGIKVWPLEKAFQQSTVTEILDRLDRFQFESATTACGTCKQDYKRIVSEAEQGTRDYFDGMCLDCSDMTKSIKEDADMDYWKHDQLKETDWMKRCRVKHKQPTWYFSFMGRKIVRDRFLQMKRKARRFGWTMDTDSDSD